MFPDFKPSCRVTTIKVWWCWCKDSTHRSTWESIHWYSLVNRLLTRVPRQSSEVKNRPTGCPCERHEMGSLPHAFLQITWESVLNQHGIRQTFTPSDSTSPGAEPGHTRRRHVGEGGCLPRHLNCWLQCLEEIGTDRTGLELGKISQWRCQKHKWP